MGRVVRGDKFCNQFLLPCPELKLMKNTLKNTLEEQFKEDLYQAELEYQQLLKENRCPRCGTKLKEIYISGEYDDQDVSCYDIGCPKCN